MLFGNYHRHISLGLPYSPFNHGQVLENIFAAGDGSRKRGFNHDRLNLHFSDGKNKLNNYPNGIGLGTHLDSDSVLNLDKTQSEVDPRIGQESQLGSFRAKFEEILEIRSCWL